MSFTNYINFKTLCLCGIIFFFLQAELRAQSLEPVQIAEKFFSKDTAGISAYLCCEMLREEEPDTLTSEEKVLKKRADDSLRISMGIPSIQNPVISVERVQQGEYSAIVSVNLAEDTLSQDYYLYFTNYNGWKIEGIRSLSLPGFVYMLLKEARNITEEEKLSFSEIGIEYDALEQSIKEITLLLKSDKALIKHFEDNREKFMLFLSEAKRLIPSNSQYSISRNDSIPSLDSYGRELIISYIEKDHCSNTKISGAVSLVIGGVLDNTAGYMYLEDPVNLPEINKSGIIILKPMGGGWYLFKTT